MLNETKYNDWNNETNHNNWNSVTFIFIMIILISIFINLLFL